jgi:hypothetical protein
VAKVAHVLPLILRTYPLMLAYIYTRLEWNMFGDFFLFFSLAGCGIYICNES